MAWFTKSVLSGYVFLSGAVVLFVVLNWQVYGASPAGIALYFVAPLSGLAISLIFLFLVSRNARMIFVSVTVATLASGYLFEAMLFFSQTHGFEQSNTERPSAADLLDREVPIFLPPGPLEFAAGFEMAPGDLVVPLAGVPNVSTAVWVTPSEEPVVYIADRFEFRNPDAVWNSEHVLVAAVGDSFAFGAESTIENSIVGRLRSLEPSTVNLARGGNGPLAELATIREYLTAFEPEIVIWFYYRNDLEQDLNRERGDPVLSRYTEPDFTQDLAADPEGFAAAFRQAYIEKALAQKDPPPVLPTTDEKPGWLERLQFGQGANPLNNLSFLTLRRTRTSLGLVKGGGDWPDPLEQPMKNILAQAKGSIAQWGGELVFVYLPSWAEIVDNDRTKFDFRNAALSAARAAEIPVLDLFEKFDAHPDPKSLWPNRKPGHYGPDGNALAAREVVRWLEEIGAWPTPL